MTEIEIKNEKIILEKGVKIWSLLNILQKNTDKILYVKDAVIEFWSSLDEITEKGWTFDPYDANCLKKGSRSIYVYNAKAIEKLTVREPRPPTPPRKSKKKSDSDSSSEDTPPKKNKSRSRQRPYGQMGRGQMNNQMGQMNGQHMNGPPMQGPYGYGNYGYPPQGPPPHMNQNKHNQHQQHHPQQHQHRDNKQQGMIDMSRDVNMAPHFRSKQNM